MSSVYALLLLLSAQEAIIGSNSNVQIHWVPTSNVELILYSLEHAFFFLVRLQVLCNWAVITLNIQREPDDDPPMDFIF